MPTLDLPESYRQILMQLLEKYVPDAEVWAYGSRVSAMHMKPAILTCVAQLC